MKDRGFEITRGILKLGNRLNYIRDNDLEKRNLTPVQSETMLFFSANEGATISDLKDHLKISHQAARNILERLKTKKYLYTVVSEKDKRANSVYLTEEGRTLINSLKGTGSKVGEVLLAGFSEEEKNMFLYLINKASDNMK